MGTHTSWYENSAVCDGAPLSATYKKNGSAVEASTSRMQQLHQKVNIVIGTLLTEAPKLRRSQR